MSEFLDQIRVLAEEPSKESIDALLVIMNDESISDEEFAVADEVFKEVSFLYAFPQDEAEERDWNICSLIAQRLNSLQELAVDFHEEEMHLDEAKLEAEVADRLLQQATEDQKENRKIEFDMTQAMIEQSLEECALIEQDMEEIKTWIDCAHELLATEKFQQLPEECLEVLFGEEEEEDDEFYDDEDDMDGCEGACEGDCEGECEKEEGEEDGCCGGGCCKE